MAEPHTGTPSRLRPQPVRGTRLASAAQPPPQLRSGPRRPVELIARAKEQLRCLTGYGVDSVSGFTKVDDGWHLSFTMVELHRVPPVTDMLAGYEVELDAAGNIVSYRR